MMLVADFCLKLVELVVDLMITDDKKTLLIFDRVIALLVGKFKDSQLRLK